MKYIRYEYTIKDKQIGEYVGSFTLKEDANKSIVTELNAYEVERFEA